MLCLDGTCQLRFNCSELGPLSSMPSEMPVNVSVELHWGHLTLGALPQALTGVLLPVEVGGEGLATPRPVKRCNKVESESSGTIADDQESEPIPGARNGRVLEAVHRLPVLCQVTLVSCGEIAHIAGEAHPMPTT